MKIIVNDIDYGDLELFEFDGRQFLMREDEGNWYGFKKLEMTQQPEFLSIMMIKWNLSDIVQATVWPLRKEDVQPLTKAFSLVQRNKVLVSCMARILVAYHNGEVVLSVRTLDEYYDNMTAEELEATRI